MASQGSTFESVDWFEPVATLLFIGWHNQSELYLRSRPIMVKHPQLSLYIRLRIIFTMFVEFAIAYCCAGSEIVTVSTQFSDTSFQCSDLDYALLFSKVL